MQGYTVESIVAKLSRRPGLTIDQDKHTVLVTAYQGIGTLGRLDFLRSQGYQVTVKVAQ